ncbi:MAG: ribulose-phosphate 3-epimerase [Bacteroidia bacterium]|nr:ribulose-phosphate 3-epimerase [Bacteroidia bacterium]
MLNRSQADWIHLDIMDGVFVPNISFGPMVVERVKKSSLLPLDVHLMIVQPEKYISTFRLAGADILTVHYEACTHLHRTIQQIKAEGMKAGVSLNPHTPVSLLEDIIHDIDLVLIMSVNPGFGGQKFIENSYLKIHQLSRLINDRQSRTLIEVDGGVDTNNAAKLVDAGVNVLVAGNSVFSSTDPVGTIAILKGENSR